MTCFYHNLLPLSSEEENCPQQKEHYGGIYDFNKLLLQVKYVQLE